MSGAYDLQGAEPMCHTQDDDNATVAFLSGDPVRVSRHRFETVIRDTAVAFSTLMPAHKAGLYLSHNDHLTMYETVAEWIGNRDDQGPDWVSEEEKERAKATNEMWELHWYPNTPVGLNHVAASSLVALLAYVALDHR